MAVIDYALRHDNPTPEKTVRFPSPCPHHCIGGDESRLDFRSSGWQARCADGKHKRCVAVWRHAVMCDVLISRYYCERALPDHLRKLLPTVSVAGVARPRGVSAGIVSSGLTKAYANQEH